MFLIASYPRSGNHLVRFFVEYMTGRATLGCIDTPADAPICTDRFDQERVLAHVTVDRPVGHKAHRPDEIKKIMRRHNVTGLILIWRDPTEAILAHVDRPRRDLFSVFFRQRLRRNVADYLALLEFYRDAELPKLLLRYEDWITMDAELFRRELDRLAAFMGLDVVLPDRLARAKTDFETLRRLSANPRQRFWKGFRSNAQRSYHQLRAAPETLKFIQSAVRPVTQLATSLQENPVS